MPTASLTSSVNTCTAGQEAIRIRSEIISRCALPTTVQSTERGPNSLLVDKERILHKRGKPHNSCARQTSRIRGNMGGDRPLLEVESCEHGRVAPTAKRKTEKKRSCERKREGGRSREKEVVLETE